MVRVGILGLTGCSGCQCEILNCEDAIISLLGRVDFSFFPLAKDSNSIKNLDILFVEGSVSSELDEELVKKGRENSKLLVAIGSCACYGGVQAQRNDEVSLEEMIREVYGEKGVPIKVFKAKPLREVVKVDYELPGCPLDKKQFIYAVSFLLNGIRP
ncbi:NADH ubiquinone oxidoreductase, subunit [Balnearium lithotrophicum]|uniref:NADH ubiquinone oxidoreductase, subunit n=1 Tax=Balnearium lithotrophicum TaxID=223788 RepID=A0A521C097_9BACT|nr:hypothetical protein [Balnearium lithotrophicum]SMO52886.1 NADH ubiquinone oxidoreductase, subunit [Balnearium lithotrophicum]